MFDKGFKKFIIKITDTDMFVTSVAMCSILPDYEIWVAFGHGIKKNFAVCLAKLEY